VCKKKYTKEIADYYLDELYRELKPFQGIWRPVSMVQDGTPRPDWEVGPRRVIIVGDEYCVDDGDGMVRLGTFRIDPRTTPMRIVTEPVVGQYQGKSVPGICEVDGGSLRLCFAPPEGEPPPEFYAPSGSRCWLTVDEHVPRG
jgi:uncharacterized protein (TIGR03067 family)